MPSDDKIPSPPYRALVELHLTPTTDKLWGKIPANKLARLSRKLQRHISVPYVIIDRIFFKASLLLSRTRGIQNTPLPGT